MKKFVYTFALILMSGTAVAQEAIPLFSDDTYSTTPTQGMQQTDKNVKNQQPAISTQSNSSMPRIGRNAQPLSQFVLEPIPNIPFTININPDDTPKNKTP